MSYLATKADKQLNQAPFIKKYYPMPIFSLSKKLRSIYNFSYLWQRCRGV